MMEEYEVGEEGVETGTSNLVVLYVYVGGNARPAMQSRGITELYSVS